MDRLSDPHSEWGAKVDAATAARSSAPTPAPGRGAAARARITAGGRTNPATRKAAAITPCLPAPWGAGLELSTSPIPPPHNLGICRQDERRRSSTWRLRSGRPRVLAPPTTGAIQPTAADDGDGTRCAARDRTENNATARKFSRRGASGTTRRWLALIDYWNRFPRVRPGLFSVTYRLTHGRVEKARRFERIASRTDRDPAARQAAAAPVAISEITARSLVCSKSYNASASAASIAAWSSGLAWPSMSQPLRPLNPLAHQPSRTGRRCGTPFSDAFMPLVPLASSGLPRIVQPHVAALHQVVRHVHVVVLDEAEAAAELGSSARGRGVPCRRIRCTGASR